MGTLIGIGGSLIKTHLKGSPYGGALVRRRALN